MSKSLYDDSGQSVQLGVELGRGGEGSVYDTPSAGKDIVAKIYNSAVPQEKRAKLQAMSKVGDSYLRQISAWPSRLLSTPLNGPIVGFLMPKVAGYEPIHHLYSPAHRKQLFPKADFALLIATARNVAAAFDSIHAHGHVIGDVNQGNIVVTGNSTVKLIDCDSFQITEKGVIHICEVGVPHFTPPELQHLRSFRGIIRTPNHDNFGLAVLVFHLLFMGRHPYSGRFLGSGDMPLERAIAEYRFAYGPNNKSRLMDVPPSAPPLDLLPESMKRMVEVAFTEHGTKSLRPSASDWVRALQELSVNLKTCSVEAFHKYPNHLSTCPWCHLQSSTGAVFFVAPVTQVSSLPLTAGTTWQHIWAQINAISAPSELPNYATPTFAGTSRPLPPEITASKNSYRLQIAAAILGACVATFAVPDLWLLWLLMGFAVVYFAKDPLREERVIRNQALKTAQISFESRLTHYQRLGGTEQFKAKKHDLEKIKSQLETLATRYQVAQKKLRDSQQTKQLHAYLDRFFISQATIPGIGAGRTATLASFGIETAADIEPSRIRNVRGFGDSLTSELVRWRRSHESRFTFNPSQPIDPREVQALNVRFNSEQAHHELALRMGTEMLHQLRLSILSAQQQAKAALDDAALAVGQARADIAILK
ncbi:helix-hairpin-helix domain-containing protein [Collimonas pratensis]|uniref:Kinase domain protein n=1 Tax=Collimonas pratensis TaxID=279113 RepID=A0ABM5Z6U3_9BURK|nr:hypothetical protein [Collimonas pratensis]AMP14891.1 kinase domain protein [Collimonas pratensis]